MKFEHVCTLRGELSAPIDFGHSAKGQRLFFAVTGGTVSGPGISGTLLPSGGDWITLRDSSRAELDVRVQVRTDDGAHIYIHYPGWIELNDKVMAALAGGPETTFDDLYGRCTPRMETGADAYDWINSSVFVGRNRVVAGPAIEVEIYLVK